MRRYDIFTFFAAGILALSVTGCSIGVDDIFDRSAAERINDAVVEYSQVVSSSAGGWVMEYYPTNGLESPTGSGYLIMADIRPDGSVAMAMDNEITGGTLVADTSMWNVIRDNGPVLSFSTYNKCIHTFCDPAIYETGLGYEGDYEFLIISMEKDAPQAMLKGKKRGVYVRMSRVPEGTVFADYLADVAHFQDSVMPVKAVNYNLLHIGDSLFRIENISSGIPNIYPYDGDAIADESLHPFLVTAHSDGYHLRFRSPVEKADAKIQEFVYDDSQGAFLCVDNDKVSLTGPNPVTFFAESAVRHFWPLTLKSNAMSADLFEKYSAINTEGGKLKEKYSVKSMQFSSFVESDSAKSVSLDITFTTSKNRTAKVCYIYDAAIADGTIELSAPQPKDNTAENVMKSLPSIAAFIEAVSDTYLIRGAVSNFCMNDLVLSSGNGNVITVKYSEK